MNHYFLYLSHHSVHLNLVKVQKFNCIKKNNLNIEKIEKLPFIDTSESVTDPTLLKPLSVSSETSSFGHLKFSSTAFSSTVSAIG